MLYSLTKMYKFNKIEINKIKKIVNKTMNLMNKIMKAFTNENNIHVRLDTFIIKQMKVILKEAEWITIINRSNVMLLHVCKHGFKRKQNKNK